MAACCAGVAIGQGKTRPMRSAPVCSAEGQAWRDRAGQVDGAVHVGAVAVAI
jgi:hypothetical protein